MTGEGDPPLGNPVTWDVHTTTAGIDLGSVAPDPTLVTMDIGVTAAMNTPRTTPGHSIGLPTTAYCIIGAPVYTTTAEILPTVDCLLATIFPMMTADPNIALDAANTNQPEDQQQQHRHHLGNMKIRNKSINKSPLMILFQNIIAYTRVKLTLRMIYTRCTLS